PNLPITRLSTPFLASGEIRTTLAVAATSINVVHEAGCHDLGNCAEVPVQPLHLHNQMLHPVELRPMLELGLTRALGLEFHVPFRMVATTIRYTTPEGAPYLPLDAGIHHRNETISGIADPWLLARVTTLLSRWWLSARAGVSIPLGHTVENPFALGEMGLAHEHIQLGNGTLDPILGVDLARTFGSLSVNGYSQAHVTLYRNGHGFQAGNQYLVGAQIGGRTFGKLAAMVGSDLVYDAPERWEGTIQQDGNLGRTELLAGLSLIYPIGATTISATVRTAIYRHIVSGPEAPGSLSSPATITLIASRTFGGQGP
ncbi:MAG TPA: hypothetical protein VFH73_20180, partial [Polyangia bacterium]|nr:hypothetical protein [Polyangia bacterium]